MGGFSGFRVRGFRVLVCLWMRASGSCDLRLWRLHAWLVVQGFAVSCFGVFGGLQCGIARNLETCKACSLNARTYGAIPTFVAKIHPF